MSVKLGDMKYFGKAAKQGVAWSFLREGVTQVLTFPASMVLARLLTPTEFGISMAALFFIQLSARLSDLGLNAALVRAKIVTPLHLSSVFAIHLGVGVVCFFALLAIAPWAAAFYGIPEIRSILPIAALGFLITPFGTVQGAMLARDGRFREASIVDWYFCVTFASVSTLLAWLGFSFWSLVYARLASVGVQVLSRIYYEPWRPSLRLSRAALRDVLGFGLGMHAKRSLDYLAMNLDNLIIGKVMGMAALGLYDKAFSTMNRVVTRLNTGGPTVMFRIFSLMQDDPGRLQRAYAKVLLSASLVSFPLLAVLIATAPNLILVLFGPQWQGAVLPFQVLCLAGGLKVLNTYASAATQAAGRVWSEVWRQISYIVLIASALYLLRNWGPAGAAIGVLVATFVMFIMMHILLRRTTGLTLAPLARAIAPAVTCAIWTAGLVLGLQAAIHWTTGRPNPWVLVLAQAVLAVLSYAAFVLFVPSAPVRALVNEVASDMLSPALRATTLLRLYLHEPPSAPVA